MFIAIVEIGGGTTLRLFTKHLVEMASTALTGSATVLGRACITTSSGVGTMTYTVYRW